MFRYTDLFKPEAIAIYFVIAATFVYAAIPEETEEEQGDQDAPHGLGSQKKAVATEHKVPILRRRSQEIMQSKLGPVQITFYGEKSSVPRILTLHDIASNHSICFASFWGAVQKVQPFSRASVLNIDLPGHFPNSKATSSFTLDQVVQVVAEVVAHFDYGGFFGFGVGAGANVLLRYAVENPEEVRALLLCNACINTTPWWERLAFRTLRSFQIGRTALAPRVRNALINYMLGQFTPQPLKDEYGQAIEGMDASSLMAYIDAFVGRAPITKSELAVLGKEKVEAFLFAGGSSSHLWPLTPNQRLVTKTLDLLGCLNKVISTWLEIRQAGRLIPFEAPLALETPLKYFFYGLGYRIEEEENLLEQTAD